MKNFLLQQKTKMGFLTAGWYMAVGMFFCSMPKAAQAQEKNPESLFSLRIGSPQEMKSSEGVSYKIRVTNPTHVPFVVVKTEIPYEKENGEDEEQTGGSVAVTDVRIEPHQSTEMRAIFSTSVSDMQVASLRLMGYFDVEPGNRERRVSFQKEIPILLKNEAQMRVQCSGFEEAELRFVASLQKPEYHPTQSVSCKNHDLVPWTVSLQLPEKNRFYFKSTDGSKNAKTETVVLKPMEDVSFEIAYMPNQKLAAVHKSTLQLIAKPATNPENQEPAQNEISLKGTTYSSFVQQRLVQDPLVAQRTVSPFEEPTITKNTIDFGMQPQNKLGQSVVSWVFETIPPFALEKEMEIRIQGADEPLGFEVVPSSESKTTYQIKMKPGIELGARIKAQVEFVGLFVDTTNPSFRQTLLWRFDLSGGVAKPVAIMQGADLGVVFRGRPVVLPIVLPKDIKGQHFAFVLTDPKTNQPVPGASVFPANHQEAPKDWDGKTLFLRTDEKAPAFWAATLQLAVGQKNPDRYEYMLQTETVSVLVQPKIDLGEIPIPTYDFVELPWPPSLKNKVVGWKNAGFPQRTPDSKWLTFSTVQATTSNGTLDPIVLNYSTEEIQRGKQLSAIALADAILSDQTTARILWPVEMQVSNRTSWAVSALMGHIAAWNTTTSYRWTSWAEFSWGLFAQDYLKKKTYVDLRYGAFVIGGFGNQSSLVGTGPLLELWVAPGKQRFFQIQLGGFGAFLYQQSAGFLAGGRVGGLFHLGEKIRTAQGWFVGISLQAALNDTFTTTLDMGPLLQVQYRFGF